MEKNTPKVALRPYRSDDCEALAALFYDTVHTVNRGDYSDEQLDAWATGRVDLDKLDRSFRTHETLVAEYGGVIVGFGDLDVSVECSACAVGYLDRLYVHRDFQRRGIGRSLVTALEGIAEQSGAGKMIVYASITALPFFEAMGYNRVCENTVVRNGVALKNYRMTK